jgi:hypothetical protein
VPADDATMDGGTGRIARASRGVSFSRLSSRPFAMCAPSSRRRSPRNGVWPNGKREQPKEEAVVSMNCASTMGSLPSEAILL